MAGQGRDYWLARMVEHFPFGLEYDYDEDVQCYFDQFAYCGHQAGLSDDEVQARWDALDEEDASHFC